MKDKDININCRKLTVTDNVTKFTSTRNNTPAPPSHSPVLAVSFDLSQITDAALRKMMDQHSSYFGEADFNTPCTHNTTHRIAVSTQPNFCTPRKLCPEKLSIAKSSFDEMQRLGFIRPSKSPYATPLQMVPKNYPGDWRPCRNYRALNQITVRDSYPEPRLSLFALHDKHVFNKLDLVKTYHQISMRSDDIEKTAITTPFGLFEFLRMPFGHKNAGKTFQRFINEVTNWLQDVLAYADDILVASNNLVDHINALAELFNRLEKFGLCIIFKKCQWIQNEIDFLGYTMKESNHRQQGPRPSQSYQNQQITKIFDVIMGISHFIENTLISYGSLLRFISLAKHKTVPKC